MENIVEIIDSTSASYRSSFSINEFNNTEFDIFLENVCDNFSF